MGSLIGRCSRPAVTCLQLHAWNRRKWRFFYSPQFITFCSWNCELKFLLLSVTLTQGRDDADKALSTSADVRRSDDLIEEVQRVAKCMMIQTKFIFFDFQNREIWYFSLAIPGDFAAICSRENCCTNNFNLPTVGWKRDFTVATSLFSAAECATLPPRRRVGFVLMMIVL